MGGSKSGTWDLNFPSSLGWTGRLEGCCPAGECPRRAALTPPSCLHLHFASFQSVEVLRSTFAAMARGAQVRTPALRPTGAAPQAPTPAEVRARGWCALRDAGGPHALLWVLVAPAEGPGQGRGAPSSCPAARSSARRRDTRLCRNMSRRRGAAPRPLRLYLPCSGSLSLIYLGTGWRVPARGDLPRSQRAARPENPGAPLGTLELVVPAADRPPRTRKHTCAPRPASRVAQRWSPVYGPSRARRAPPHGAGSWQPPTSWWETPLASDPVSASAPPAECTEAGVNSSSVTQAPPYPQSLGAAHPRRHWGGEANG